MEIDQAGPSKSSVAPLCALTESAAAQVSHVRVLDGKKGFWSVAYQSQCKNYIYQFFTRKQVVLCNLFLQYILLTAHLF
jgi:hypothetical protein